MRISISSSVRRIWLQPKVTGLENSRKGLLQRFALGLNPLRLSIASFPFLAFVQQFGARPDRGSIAIHDDRHEQVQGLPQPNDAAQGALVVRMRLAPQDQAADGRESSSDTGPTQYSRVAGPYSGRCYQRRNNSWQANSTARGTGRRSLSQY